MSTRLVISKVWKQGKQAVQNVIRSKVGKQPVADRAKPAYIAKEGPIQPKQRLLIGRLFPLVPTRTLASELRRRAANRFALPNRPTLLPTFALAFAGVALQQQEADKEDLSSEVRAIFCERQRKTSLFDKVQQLSLGVFDLGNLIGQGCNAAVYDAKFKSPQYDEFVQPIHEDDNDDNSVISDDTDSDIVVISDVGEQSDLEDIDDDIVMFPEQNLDHDVFVDDNGNDDSDIVIIEDVPDQENDSDLSDHDDEPLNDSIVNNASEFVQPIHENDNDDSSVISDDTDSDIVVISDVGEQSDLEDIDDDIVMFPEQNLDHDVFVDDNGNDDSDIVIIEDAPDQENDSNIVIIEDVPDLETDSDLSDHDDEPLNDSIVNNASEKQGETTIPDPGDNKIGPQKSDEYFLAIKIMYNYDIESNTDAIMRAMLKEAVPARMLTVNQDDNQLWQNGNRVRLKSLPGHPNIVEMLGVFVDPLPDLPGALDNYPAALPQRLNPQGFGRNQTMFLVMKKYDMTLRECLAQEELSPHTRCLLLSQLLEGTVHLRQHGIAHRDLKSDNILLDCHNDVSAPHLVISDFGCCLADEENGLQLPYPTDEINKGGNGALMPPEISCSTPGRNVKLDYSKSDLWAVGSLAFEVFGQDNPFYGGARITRKLDGRTYQDGDIPSMLGDIPDVVNFLVPRMLRRDPNQRPEPEMAANLLQIYLHFPEWLQPGNKPSKKHITENLMILVAQILIGWKLRGERSFTVEEQLQVTFLRRLVISDLEQALAYYHGN